MAASVYIECPNCGAEFRAEPAPGDGSRERLRGRGVACHRCGRPVELYYY
jgi:DNA-directed RNA polymerase subunit RPC12/RpoP